MFSGLIKNEYIKLFSKKKTYIILGLYILLSIIIAMIGESFEKNYFRYKDPDYLIENINHQIQYEKEYLDSIQNDSSIDEDEKEMLLKNSNEHIETLKEEIKRLEERKKTGEYDWREEYREQIAANESIIKEIEAKGNLSKDDLNQVNYMKQDIERLNILLSTDTSPEDENVNTGINYLYNNLLMVTSAFLSFGLILFSSDSVSGEYNPGTLKFLLIQPVTRIKVLLSKFVVTALSSVTLILGGQALFFVIVGLIKGFGKLSRPMLVGQEFEKVIYDGFEMFQRIAGSGEYIPLWNYILRMLILEIFLIITVTAFIFMVSTISKSSVVANTMCISIMLGSTIVYNLSSSYRKISHLIFLNFGDIDGIVSGSIISNTGKVVFTPINVIIVCVITTIVFVLVSLGVFKKRDLLI